MAKIISFHSFRGGTGKSNTAANIAALLAEQGQRVGVVDTDIQSPGVHVLFGLAGAQIGSSLNDYLWGRCKIREVAQDVTAALAKTAAEQPKAGGGKLAGKVYLIPSSIQANEISQVLREGYDVQVLTQGLRDFIDTLKLDVLIIDTHPGLDQETLLAFVLADTLAVLLRPDQQDYEGTGVTVEVARQLEVKRLMLIVNKVYSGLSEEAVRTQVEQTYNCPVAAVIKHSDELMALGSGGVFALQHPDHPLTEQYRRLAETLMEA